MQLSTFLKNPALTVLSARYIRRHEDSGMTSRSVSTSSLSSSVSMGLS